MYTFGFLIFLGKWDYLKTRSRVVTRQSFTGAEQWLALQGSLRPFWLTYVSYAAFLAPGGISAFGS